MGPILYTRELGGHGSLLRHHANRSITEAQRQRFVEVFLEAADEVGLPSDERFRRRFREYIEWGARPGLRTASSICDQLGHQPAVATRTNPQRTTATASPARWRRPPTNRGLRRALYEPLVQQ